LILPLALGMGTSSRAIRSVISGSVSGGARTIRLFVRISGMNRTAAPPADEVRREALRAPAGGGAGAAPAGAEVDWKS